MILRNMNFGYIIILSEYFFLQNNNITAKIVSQISVVPNLSVGFVLIKVTLNKIC